MNKKNFNGFLRKNYTWIISMLIVFVFMLFFMLVFKVTPFGTNTFVASDCYHQMYPMLAHLQYVLKNHESLFYSWNSALGGDFMPSYFYYIASPINLLVVFIDRSNLQSFISITIALRIVMSAGTFGFFLSRRNDCIENSPVYIAFSCGYALSNYMCGYYYQIMWLDSLVIFPLIILGYCKLKDNKPILYVLSLAYSLFCNYYISYIICIYLVLIFLFDKYKNIKEFFIRGLRFAGYSILAAGLAAVSLFTSYIGLTKTASVGEKVVLHTWYGNIFEVLRQHFILSNPIVTSYNNNDTNIYCGSIVIFCLFIFLSNSKVPIYEKIKKCLLIVLFVISMNESVLNFLWHGFHEQHSVPNRFAFLYILLLLSISADSFKNLEYNSLKSIVICFGLVVLVPFLSYFFVDFNSILSSHQILIITEILLFIYFVLVLLYRYWVTNKKRKIIEIVLTSLIIIEVLFNSMLVLKIKLTKPLYENVLFDSITDVKKEVESNEKSIFYRSDFTHTEFNNINMFQGLKGVGIFNSTSNVRVLVFAEYMGNHTSKNRLMFSQSKNYLDDIMGIKYIYSIKGSHDYEYDDSYKLLYEQNGINVYQNTDALSLGFAVDSKLKDFGYKDHDNTSLNVNYLIYLMTGVEPIFSQTYLSYDVNAKGCELGVGDTDYLSMQYEDYDDKDHRAIDVAFNIEDEGVYFLNIMADNQDSITIKKDEEILKSDIWLANGLNTLGKLNKDNKITVTIADNTEHKYQENSPVSEIKMFVYKMNMDKVQEMYEYLSKNQMELTLFEPTKVCGSVTLDENQLLFTSIPYDKGWHVYDNGKEVKTFMLAQAFLGVDLGPGEHNLEFKFIPEGFYPGIIISVVSCIIFIFICINHRKKKHNNNEEDDREDAEESYEEADKEFDDEEYDDNINDQESDSEEQKDE